MMKLR